MVADIAGHQQKRAAVLGLPDEVAADRPAQLKVVPGACAFSQDGLRHLL
jgi:hypothetical protein